MADITIKLNNSLCARGFSSEERIHNNAFERTVGMINKQIEKAEGINGIEQLKGNDMIRTYETISVCHCVTNSRIKKKYRCFL